MLTFPLLGVVRELMRFASHGVSVVGTNNAIKLGKRQFANSSCEDRWTGIHYRDFDVLIPDIDEQKLIDIGFDNRTTHLSIGSFPDSPFPIKGRVHGINLRLMAPLVCRYNGNDNSRPFNVWFLVDPGSPYTSLTVKSLETLVGQGFTHGLHSIAIQDPSTNIECRLSKAHFSEVNLLGMDALQILGLSIGINWKRKEFKLDKNLI